MADAVCEHESFVAGESFPTYDDLEKKLERFKHQTFTEFWKRDARSVESATRRMDRHLKKELKYYEVTFCCIHGGKSFKPKGKGVRITS